LQGFKRRTNGRSQGLFAARLTLKNVSPSALLRLRLKDRAQHSCLRLRGGSLT
jgi:hypothetical protein